MKVPVPSRSLVLLFSILLLLAACSKPADQSADTPTDSLQLSYSQGFSVYYYPDHTDLLVYTPGTRDIAYRQSIKQPLTKLVTTSATYIGFLEALDALNCVVGATNTNLIYSKALKTIDVGDAMQLDAERILAVKPQAVLLTDYGTANNQTDVLQQLGIQLFYVDEWREQNPLARAEWIKYIGVLVGKQQEADSIFHEVETAYLKLKKQKLTGTKTILSGNDFRGTWYVPSGNTYMGQLFADAGFDYRYQKDSTAGSLPLTFESVLHDFADADVWVGVGASSLAELKSMEEKHSLFKAYKQQQVYNFNAHVSATGGNDFWESGVVHPERILSDLSCIRQDKTDSLFYAVKLKPN